MNMSVQRRIAAEILGCGVHKVWMDASKAEEISMAITRDDLRKLVGRGIIKKKPVRGPTRIRAARTIEQKKRGRGGGHGTVKGKSSARNPPKKSWMKKIRIQRKRLAELRDAKKIEKGTYRRFYLMAKGGAFRSLAQLNSYLEEQRLLVG